MAKHECAEVNRFHHLLNQTYYPVGMLWVCPDCEALWMRTMWCADSYLLSRYLRREPWSRVPNFLAGGILRFIAKHSEMTDEEIRAMIMQEDSQDRFKQP